MIDRVLWCQITDCRVDWIFLGRLPGGRVSDGAEYDFPLDGLTRSVLYFKPSQQSGGFSRTSTRLLPLRALRRSCKPCDSS